MNTPQTNHISVARQHLLDQLAALRQASTPEALKTELARAKGVSEVAQALTNTARVEVEYLIATGQNSAPFLEASEEGVELLPNGITSITRHRIGG